MKKSFKALGGFVITMLIALTIAFCSCAPKMGCTSPQTDYWEYRKIDRN